MKLLRLQLITLFILAGSLSGLAGSLSYVAIPATQSDENSGINNQTQYTSAVDGGNTNGADRMVNGVRLYSLTGSGQSAAADNCVLNVLSGNLGSIAQPEATIEVDGALKEALSDMTVNDGAGDNSQQEIVLDPSSLTAGTTYDLRIYISNSGRVDDREVNLSFVGDGQPPVETGFFNEEDARTSPGGFRDRNQVYYTDYRFTWDGTSTPGVTISQKSGQAPFVLYALTNEPAAEGAAAAAPAETAAAPAVAPVATGLVSAVSDRVGVTSETFYTNQSLKKHGRWIDIKKYGRCWQPTDCPPDWQPYRRGHFVYSDDGGYTWVSDKDEGEWGWACYHYGRWCRVRGVGSGWAWVPGTAWSGAWVSWRQGREGDHSYLGWAPLPPEATCRVGVGISTWADQEYDIGPDSYTFVTARDFGSDSYARPGLIVDRGRYVDLVARSVNITNINYTDTRGNVANVSITELRAYNGGPDLTWINSQIREHGGREVPRVRIDRVAAENLTGGTGRRMEGNTLVIFAPNITHQANPKVLPKVVATVPDNKIDHGWEGIKDPKTKTELRNQIAQQNKGQTPATTKAVLPPPVVQAAAKAATASSLPGQSPSPAGSLVPSPAPTIPTSSSSATASNSIAASPSATAPRTSAAPSPIRSPATALATPGASASTVPLLNKALHPGEKIASTPAPSIGPMSSATAHPAGSATAAPLPTAAVAAQSSHGAVLHPGAPAKSESKQTPSPTASPANFSATPATTPSAAGKILHPGGTVAPARAQSRSVLTATPAASPAIGPARTSALHPGATLAPSPAAGETRHGESRLTPPTAVLTPAESVSPVATSHGSAVGREENQRGSAKPTQTPRPSVAGVSPTPAAKTERSAANHQTRERNENRANTTATPTPAQPRATTTPVEKPPLVTRTAARSIKPAATSTPVPAKKGASPSTEKESASPLPSRSSKQQPEGGETQKLRQQHQSEAQDQQLKQQELQKKQAQQEEQTRKIEQRIQQGRQQQAEEKKEVRQQQTIQAEQKKQSGQVQPKQPETRQNSQAPQAQQAQERERQLQQQQLKQQELARQKEEQLQQQRRLQEQQQSQSQQQQSRRTPTPTPTPGR